MRMAMLAALAAMPLLAEPAAAKCSVPRFSFFPNRQVDASMRVGSGETCHINIRAHPESRFDKAAIVAAPGHGRASASLGAGVTYRSCAGYAGQDVFVYAVTGKMRSGTGTAKVRVTVSVAGEGRSAAGVATRKRSLRATRARATTPEIAAHRACRRGRPAMYDRTMHVWLHDNRLFNLYWDCVARKLGVSGTSGAR